MQIKGRQYTHKRAELGLVKQAKKFVAESGLDVNIDAEIDTPEWAKAEKDWVTFCAMIFEKPDDNLSLATLTSTEVRAAIESFFSPPATQTQK